MKTLIRNILSFNRIIKQLIMIGVDLILLPISLVISFALQYNDYLPLNIVSSNQSLFYFIPFVMLPLFIINGLYRSVLKYMGYHIIVAVMRSISIGIFFIIIFIHMFSISTSVSTVFIFWFVAILLTVGSRYLLKLFVYYSDYNKKPVAIYGIGKTGIQLIDNLKGSSEYIPVALFDNEKKKWGSVVNSILVYNPKNMENILKQKKIKLILLAMPELLAEQQKKILRKISDFPVEVRVIPSLENIISEKIDFDSVKKVDVLDILGREPVKPSEQLLYKNIRDKNILVTGAGGSIGIELCSQIVNLCPKRIIVLDHSEFALYNVNSLLKGLVSIEIIPVLTSITEFKQILNIIELYDIDTIYHAAAYKHVPMVELNPFDGVRNNILGTYNLVKAAIKSQVETFVLISSDKAVRPTNVMGATKRFSELILQAAQDSNSKTCFSMVRFGNVLDSAGSVVPLFRDQIRNGGPVTVTSQKVTRYFMSVQEAVQLVIQAGAMAKGGEVFVLDMGEPIRIYDLAKKMIHLSGFKPITINNPNGEIEIEITGLRPGEKLYEELLIGKDVYTTDHPQIMQAREVKFSYKKIECAVQDIIKALKTMNLNQIKLVFVELIDGYQPSSHTFPNKKSSDNIKYTSKSDENLDKPNVRKISF